MSTTPRLLGGRYEVGELIGRGGMAEVHRGYDTRLGRDVAIKILRSDHARDSSFLIRFRREAQSVAGLNHPSIVAVYDSGEDKLTEFGGAEIDVPYIVMEYVQGRTLREVLNDEGTLEPEVAGRITAAVLDALAYSHQMGIVHRDIKPGNVMLGEGGEVKVMDFGIARAMADAQATMTQTSAVIGTAQYISPEQAEGQQVDHRSDVYSTGCLLFELLTGRTPFTGDPISLTYQHVRKAPPRPSEFVPELPSDYDAVVLHALAKDREVRYQGAGDMRTDLLRIAQGRSISPAASAALLGPAGEETADQENTQFLPAGTGGRPLPHEPETALHPVAPVDRDRRRQRSPWGWVFVVAALVAAIALGAFAVKQYRDNQELSRLVAVPRVIGLDQAVAKKRLTDARLQMNVVAEPSTDVEPGIVTDQDPDPSAEVEQNRVVTVTVSSGPAETEVPPVVGETQKKAEAMIKEAGLTLGKVTKEDSPTVPKGHVISADPTPYANLSERDPVDLAISTGAVRIPNFSGWEIQRATEWFTSRGLKVKTESITSSEEPNTVIGQDPGQGKRLNTTTFTLTYAIAAPVTVTTTQPPPATSSTTTTTSPTSSGSTSTTPSDTSSSSSSSSTTTTPKPTSTRPPGRGNVLSD
ncbi:Stk1 family PASTA domain-containing Ser/Thr kinase [Janibacter sp. G56]|uniref:Stk1 family PASTA domain-containing Ser/Thr kinase n=1 Tax=Janibacter sp. G56 TaxID=3418717 RepID=UPI003D05A009